MRPLALLLLACVSLLAACGSDEGADAEAPAAAAPATTAAATSAATEPPATSAAVEPATSAATASGDLVVVTENAVRVAAALALADGSATTVEAALIDGPDGPVLCDATTRSLPPRCVGEGLPVEGVDVLDAPGVRTDGGVAWAAAVRVTGTLQGGRLLDARLEA